MTVTVVCGPPLAGKTTHALDQASSPDRVIDYDLIAQQLGSPVSHNHPAKFTRPTRRAWLAAVREIPRRPGDWWIVRALPASMALAELRALGIDAVALELWPDPSVLFARAATRPDPTRARAALATWLDRYPQQVPSTVEAWGGSKARRWSREVLARYGRDCRLRLPGCTLVATEADHIIPRSERPDLQYDVTNGRPACRHCNASRGRRTATPTPVVDTRTFFESQARPSLTCGGSPPRGPEKMGPERSGPNDRERSRA